MICGRHDFEGKGLFLGYVFEREELPARFKIANKQPLQVASIAQKIWVRRIWRCSSPLKSLRESKESPQYTERERVF